MQQIAKTGSRIFGWGGSRGNGSEGANAGGAGGEGPPDGSEVSFFKTIQSIRKLIDFSKISTFLLPKNPFFLRKPAKNCADFNEFLIFSKNYLKIFNFYNL